ncbi:DUF1345 domain-containing protein [Pedobacter sp. HMF7647]|uniref:DUF1345 domain-containing protein n=2 Tax=Hufsiella arboris TaxID=2695275 RepID=A0A7K1Y8G7_9SPHI|nr:DUF1345 domain-containing protein [Hufsiella arboris]MXV50882.1 DUF1345 domain-containing protein [Hufsiella arboris]
MHPLHRILISLTVSLAAFFTFRFFENNLLNCLIVLWDIFALTYVALSWYVIFNRGIADIMKTARRDDGSLIYVSIIIILACFASMLAVLFLVLGSDSTGEKYQFVRVASAVIGMLLSWAMVHTTFTFHYAHIFYDESLEGSAEYRGGLDFPDKNVKPDYLDFAYFSFVIGMTFQVSDVEISSKRIRRLALVHSLLSFGLNTFVVALTINIIAGLKK